MHAQTLVVTSNNDLGRLLATIAQINGYCMHTSASAAHALSTTAREQIDLIFLDLPLADRSLEAFVHELRARLVSAQIVLMSTSDDSQLLADALALDGFLCKPFDIPQVVAWLRQLAPVCERMVGGS